MCIFICNYPEIGYAQDCDAINNIRTFHGITLGQTFPSYMRSHFLTTTGNGSIIYGLWEPMVSKSDSLAMSSWFDLGTDLSTINIYCLSDTVVSRIEFYQLYKSATPFVYKKGWTIDEYTDVTKELKYLFGEPSIKNIEYNSDDGDHNIMNVWSCNNSNIEVISYFYYNIRKANIKVVIIDNDLELKQKMQRFKTTIN